MKNNQNLIYINWDGFGYYYYLAANRKPYKGTPNINYLAKHGVLFTNLYTGIPSITNPMQAAIVTGAYSEVTGNVYKYFDRKSNRVELCKRVNKGQTIGEVLVDNSINFASIQQFALEEKGAERNQLTNLYIQPEGNYEQRFEEAKSLISEKSIEYRVLFIYMDDLDSIGHNNLYSRGKIKALTERGRIKNVVSHLIEMDKGLGDFINFLKEENIYANTNILLTTDHGMVPFKGKSGINKVIQVLQELGFNDVVYLDSGESPPYEWDVIMVGVDIQLQLYFKEDIEDTLLDHIKTELDKIHIVAECMTRQQLKERGTADFFADILISPTPPHHFSARRDRYYLSRANHDSLDDRAQHIFGLLSGPNFKKGLEYKNKTYNIDFIPTICQAMEMPIPEDARGNILTDILE